MSPDETVVTRWRLLQAIFHEVLAVPEQERPALLESRCDGDPQLRERVQALLRAAEQDTQLTESSQRHGSLPSGQSDDDSFETHLGFHMGAYQLEKLLGRGGMGAVYLAHRADGEFEHKVAVKIIGLPLELNVLRERFRQERQILARLSHPNITRLLDGGVTDDGQLYLVMEYVDGVPLDQFAGDLSAKLRLFRDVCSAVQYAHQNLVVHRDIKPSNVLVDATGVVKLLDFGSAKLLAGAEVSQTRFGMITPAFASPEQLRGEPATTQSDVYSLGAILYHLVTGQRPFGDDLVTRLRSDESSRVTLAEALPGDLDTVVRKALAPSQAQRYSSVEQLSEDVRRYQAGEAVLAHVPSFSYRAGKFVGRHKLALGAGALLLLTILLGTGGIFWQYRTAIAERRRAEARAEDLRKLSESLLTEINDAIQKLPGSTPAQQMLVSTVLAHLDQAANDSAGDPQMLLSAANAYIRLGNVQGNVFIEHTGDTRGALASLDKALSIATALTQKQPNDMSARHTLAWAQQSRSEVLFGLGRTQEAVDSMRPAIAAFDALASRPGASLSALMDAADAYTRLGEELGLPGWASLSDFPGGIAAHMKAREFYRRAMQLDPNNLSVLLAVVNNHRIVGAMQMQTDPAGALPELRAAIDGVNALQTQATHVLSVRRAQAAVIGPYAGALIEIGKYREALIILERGQAISREMVKTDPNDIRAVQNLEAGLSRVIECYQERAAGIFPETGTDRTADARSALTALTEQRSVLEEILRVEPKNANWESKLGLTLIDMARQKRALHHPEGSIELARKGLVILKEVARRPDARAYQLFDAATGLTTVEPSRLREPALAVKYAERIVEMSSRRNPEFLLTLASADRAAGQPDKARAVAREGLALLPPETSATVMSRVRKLLRARIDN